MKDRILKLIENQDYFSELWVETMLPNTETDLLILPPDIKVFGDGIQTATLIIANKEQFSNIENAFVAVFKRYLYHIEEWALCNYNDISKQVWCENLYKIWIPTYLKLNNFKAMQYEDFKPRFISEIARLNIPKKELDKFSCKLENLEIIELDRGSLDLNYDVFAINEEVCFFYSWWIGY